MCTELNLDNVNAYARAMNYCPRSAIWQGVCLSPLPVYLWSPSTVLIVRNHIFRPFGSSVSSTDGCKHSGLLEYVG